MNKARDDKGSGKPPRGPAGGRDVGAALKKAYDGAHGEGIPADLLEKIPAFPADAKIATRKAGSDVLQPLAQAIPLLISGSADLHGSTLNYISSRKTLSFREKKMYERAKYLIVSEIAVINGLDEQEVERQVDRALTKSAQGRASAGH